MSFEQTIIETLGGHAGLVALVRDRIYHHRLPEPDPNETGVQLPAITFLRVSGAKLQAMDGSIVASTPRFQFDIYGSTALDAITVSAELLQALLTLWGTAEVRFMDEGDMEDQRSRLYRRRYDVRFVHAGA